MKTLDQVRDDVALENGFIGWQHYIAYAEGPSTHMVNLVAVAFAKEVLREARVHSVDHYISLTVLEVLTSRLNKL